MPLLSMADRRPAALIAGAVLVLNGLGWGVLPLVVVPQRLSMGGSRVFGVGIGLAAFLLGVRHAFDADHIAVIDNAVRKLVGERRRALDTGLWFALGHSTVVFALALVIAVGVRAVIDPVQDEGSTLRGSLGVLGTMAAGSFLIVLGLVNLSALLGIAHLYRHWRAGVFDEALDVPGHQVGDRRLIGGRPPSAVWRRRVLYCSSQGARAAARSALLVKTCR